MRGRCTRGTASSASRSFRRVPKSGLGVEVHTSVSERGGRHEDGGFASAVGSSRWLSRCASVSFRQSGD